MIAPLALALGLVLAPQSGAQSGAQDARFLHLSFAREQVTDGAKGVEGLKLADKYRLILGPTGFQLSAADRTVIYDFERDVRLDLDPEARTYRESSLLGDLDFRVTEMANRRKLGELVRAAGVEELAAELGDLEALFGIESGEATEVGAKAVDGGFEVAVGDHVLARWTASEHAMPAGAAAMLGRALLYTCHLHPAARHAIVENGVVPASLRYETRDVGARHRVDLRLEEATWSDTGPVDVSSFERALDEHDPLERAVAKALDSKAAAANVESLQKQVEQATAAGYTLDAFLIWQEIGLQTGEVDRGKMRALLAGKGRAAVQPLVATWAAEDPNAALAAHAAIDRTGLQHGHVLDIFEGNVLIAADQREAGMQKLLGALANDPYITGVYKDLGDQYRHGFEMERAWLCYTTALRLQPDHPLLEQVRDVVKSIRARFTDVL